MGAHLEHDPTRLDHSDGADLAQKRRSLRAFDRRTPDAEPVSSDAPHRTFARFDEGSPRPSQSRNDPIWSGRALYRLCLFGFFCLASAAAAEAQTYDSAYTKLELSACVQEPLNQEEPESGGIWWCEGYGGIPVRVAEGDLRFLLSFGAAAASEPAAGQTLPQFNRIGTTLEWRLQADPATGRRPIATILRYFTETDGAPEGQVLVVTKLGGPGQVCHVGYVDALSTPDPNVMARQLAETLAPTFVCGRHRAGYYAIGP